MSDLTSPEQANVRRALTFLRARMGSWSSVAAALNTAPRHVLRIKAGGSVTATMAFRAARIAGVGVDDVLSGHYAPPGVCPHCGETLPE